MDATSFVNTALRRKSIETSDTKMTEEKGPEMDEAKSRELEQWIQEVAISKVWEGEGCLSQHSCPCVGF